MNNHSIRIKQSHTGGWRAIETGLTYEKASRKFDEYKDRYVPEPLERMIGMAIFKGNRLIWSTECESSMEQLAEWLS